MRDERITLYWTLAGIFGALKLFGFVGRSWIYIFAPIWVGICFESFILVLIWAATRVDLLKRKDPRS